ncbi:hypothetical protein ACEV9J_23755, partial [Vibrio parahaemolyticus]
HRLINSRRRFRLGCSALGRAPPLGLGIGFDRRSFGNVDDGLGRWRFRIGVALGNGLSGRDFGAIAPSTAAPATPT